LFEEYLLDSYYFRSEALKRKKSTSAKRYYRVSVFCAISALESFLNYVGEGFATSGTLNPYEIAFLTDRSFILEKGKFVISDRKEYHRLEDKLRFLFVNFLGGFDFEKAPCWARLIEFKKFRDCLVHSRENEDSTSEERYKRVTALGLSAVIEIIDNLCKGIYSKPLRKKITDLKIL
jgi:hypothetical protein